MLTQGCRRHALRLGCSSLGSVTGDPRGVVYLGLPSGLTVGGSPLLGALALSLVATLCGLAKPLRQT